jgi:rhomboid protease GluP
VRNKDYIPVANDGDNLVFNTGVNIVIKNSYQSVFEIHFVDADRFSTEEIRQALEINKTNLLDIKGSHYHYIFEVFFFSNSEDREKIKIIEDGQVHKNNSRRFLKCITVDLALKNISRHYKLPLADGGISKTLKVFFQNNENLKASTSEEISEMLLSRQKEYEIEYKAKTPLLTYTLIAINILIWAAMNLYSFKSGANIHSLLTDFGAKDNARIISGEYWRFLTPVFLHNGIEHLLLNCYSLYAIGLGVEKIYGHWRFCIIYFVAGIIGNIASFMFSTYGGVGASGAIFGLMGAMLYYGFEKPALFKNYFGPNIIITLFINLVYGFSRSGIDNFAHIGGLIGGFFATGTVCSLKERKKWYLNKGIILLVLIGITVGGLFYGFSNRDNGLLTKVSQLEQLDRDQKWDDAEKLAEEIISSGPSSENTRLQVLWMLARAEAVQQKFEEAVESAKKIVDISPKDGHYLLGAIYFDMGQYNEARQEFLEAKNLKAEYDNIDELLKQIEEIMGSHG